MNSALDNPDPLGYGDRAIRFIEKLRHTEGQFAGQRFELAEFQKRIIKAIYGNTNPDGTRKARTVFVMMPRGCGKTTLLSGLALLHLLGPEKDAAGQVICAAADREQASIAFNSALRMTRADPTLSRITRATPSLKRLEHPRSNSSLKAISAEAYSKHGMSVSFLVMDEIHALRDRELYDVLVSSMGKRHNPLTVIITTAGIGQNNIAWELYSYAKKVASGEVDDPSFLPIIFEPPEGYDWEDEDVWRAVNPSIDAGFRSLEEMRTMARRAREVPAQREVFKRLYLNEWLDGAASPWLDLKVYDAGGADPVDEEALVGEPAWIGVDLSSTSDLTAVVAAIPRDDGTVVVIPRFFVPEENIRRRQEVDRVPYVLWRDQGFLTSTPGNVVDYGMVEDEIRLLAEKYRVQEIALDRWNATATTNNLMADGLPVVAFGQGFRSMTPAVNEVERLVLSRKLRHGGHPILRWNFANVVLDEDPAQNRKMNKARSVDRIDGAVALAMAVARAASGEGMGPSAYGATGEREAGFLVL